MAVRTARARLSRASFLALTLFGAGPAAAQEPAPETRATPPVLVQGECRATLAPSGRVLLSITVSELGAVTDVSVLESHSPEIDAEVMADARAFTFEPARVNDVPTAARIRYVCNFVGAPPPTPEPSPEPNAPPEEVAPEQETPPAEPAPEPPASDEVVVEEEELEGITAAEATEAERLAESAEAVDIVSTETTRRESADLGEVLARERGVGIRRAGGLGSYARISLAGLTDDQIRFFVDGVPMEMMGFTNGIANVPVDLVDHVQIYRGVLPIRLGSDALGGAFNLAPPPHARGTHASTSFEMGSFGTYRLAASAQHRDERTASFARVSAFFDSAENDYPVNVEVADDTGHLSPVRVRRFHDAYRASGGVLELGFVDAPFADRLVLRAFATTFEKDLQNDLIMSTPYGEARYGGDSIGASLRYDHAPSEDVHLSLIGGYAYTRTDFLDVAEWVYDWYGNRGRARRIPGEITDEPFDQSIFQHASYLRLNAEWSVRAGHLMRFSVSPTLTMRTGEDRTVEDGNRDPLASDRVLFTSVVGVEYQATLFEEALQVIAFVKDYVYRARSEEIAPGNVPIRRDRDSHSFGGGFSARYRVSPQIAIEASYERATRLPRPDEVFGDGVTTLANLELVPEVTHNANVELATRRETARLGTFTVDVRGFVRVPDNFIVLLGSNRQLTYHNVFRARILGAELAARWTSPGDVVSIDYNLTYNDARNASREGHFAPYNGDRIPNRPWMFMNASARVDLRDLARTGDSLSFAYYLRYVHWFYRGWGSLGTRSSKQTIPIQAPQGVAVTYTVPLGELDLMATLEAQNVFDAEVFDFFGMQRPGRAFYGKVGVSY